jgi:4-amino-4-deoxy-L-arabinose transferase-like glycosyltransferase
MALTASAPMLLAAVLAFASLNFGLPFLLRPDEDVMVGRAVRMVAEHSLDPMFANYPPLVFYLFAAAEGIGSLLGFSTLQGAIHADPSSAYMAGRIVSALASVVTVFFTFLAGRRAYGPVAGLLAALAIAVAPLAVRQAHFATTDGVEAAFVAAALWAGLRARSARGFALAGALCGLAACAKYTGGFAIFFVLVLAWLAEDRRRHLFATVAAAVVAFWIPGLAIVTHPVDYWHGIGFLSTNAFAREANVPLGWIDIPIVIWPFGLGLGVYVAALGGIVLALVRRERVDVALVVMLAAYYVVTGAGHENFWRYQLPMLPALSLLAAGLVRIAPARVPLSAGVAVVLLLPSVYASVAQDVLLGRTDTRRLAAAWIDAHVPPGAAISSPYYGGPFYDQSELKQNRYYINDPLASGFLQGRYTDRYRINATPADVTLKASGPPYQYPLPDGGKGAAASFDAYSSRPWDAVYDDLDSYYLPFWGFENITRPGPSIAIWTSSG